MRSSFISTECESLNAKGCVTRLWATRHFINIFLPTTIGQNGTASPGGTETHSADSFTSLHAKSSCTREIEEDLWWMTCRCQLARRKTYRWVVNNHKIRHEGDNLGQTRAGQTDANANIVRRITGLAGDSAPVANRIERKPIGPLTFAHFEVSLKSTRPRGIRESLGKDHSRCSKETLYTTERKLIRICII